MQRFGTWPTARLPHPRQLLRFEEYEIVSHGYQRGKKGGGDKWIEVLAFAPVDGAKEIIQPLNSEDIYLELERADLRRPQDILDFVNRYGPLYRPRFELFEYTTAELGELQVKDYEIWVPSPRPVEPVKLFVAAAGDLRRFRRWYLEARHSPEPDAVPALTVVDDLQTGLNPYLRVFSPRILPDRPSAFYEPFGSRLDDPAMEFREQSIYVSREPSIDVSLFEICCLELFNDICTNATYRTCANPTCARPFVPKRSDQEYHSPECGRRNRWRESKRRLRANQAEQRRRGKHAAE